MRTRPVLASLAVSALLVAACKQAPPELDPDTNGTSKTTSAATTTAAGTQPTAKTMAAPPPSAAAAAYVPKDDGEFRLTEAVKDLKGDGPIVATLDTSKGKIQCRLYDDKAPVTVANFIGLATGKRKWKNPKGDWVNTPAYDGTTFHRVIQGFMIQGGDAAGNGTGDPGFEIKDEIWPGGTHNKPGLLCMANKGPNTNSAQFFITDTPGASLQNLDRLGSYTIFGECAPEQIVHDIAAVKTGRADKPLEPVTIKTVTISRDVKK